MQNVAEKAIWLVIAVFGASCLGFLALSRGESINALWIIAAALCVFAISYRFYALFLSRTVLKVDPSRSTPAVRLNDGMDFVPTPKYVLFGHHFAAIAGAGPLVGPVLAAQMGYLPGTLWILAGVVFAGAVQDMFVLFLSTRRDGKSLGEIVRLEMGAKAGGLALIGVLLIMIIILAVLALVVVKALAESSWGTFTVAATIPIALLMGLYGRYIRPGKVAEMSIMGFVLLMAALIFGQHISADPTLAPYFTFTGPHLALMIIAYGFVASVIPVWLLLAPRDYLSTFLKIGAIVALAFGIMWVRPNLEMPAVTQFIHGDGPVFSGGLFPFLFITIACGAVSGFHALIASGTTPKMLGDESQIRFIGYGSMLMESFVAIMALVATSSIEPGIYFAMNSPVALIGTTPESAAAAISSWGFMLTPEMLTTLAKDVGESTVISRAGGAPTLAVGMAHIFSQVFGNRAMMGFWYHFAILFEALFILTAVDAGTRVARFMIQDMVGTLIPSFKNTQSLMNNIIGSGIAVGLWGYILYIGVVDPLGGINSLWPLFGASNQMLAAIALTLATVVLFKMKKQKYAWVTMIPAAWLLICTLTAGYLKVFSSDPKVGFLAHASKYRGQSQLGLTLAPAKDMDQMGQIIFNDYLNATLCSFFVLIVLGILIFGIQELLKAWRNPQPTALETPYVAVSAGGLQNV